jgi:hypothetical protein
VTPTEDDTLQRMGELVRQIRKLAAGELIMRTALEQIAAQKCRSPFACAQTPDWECSACVASRALERLSPPLVTIDPRSGPEWLALAEQAKTLRDELDKS